MPQAAGCLSVPAQGAAGQEAPGLERMQEAPGSGPVSATGALRGSWARETRRRGGGGDTGARAHMRAQCLEDRSEYWGAPTLGGWEEGEEGSGPRGRERTAAAPWPPWESQAPANVWLSGKEAACGAGDAGSIPGSGRSPREGNGNPLYDCCLENPTERGAWWATVHGVTSSRT